MDIFNTIYEATGIAYVMETLRDKYFAEKAEEKKEYHADQISPKKYSYRPSDLENFVGQDNSKEKIRLNVQKILTMKPVHTIISGTRGHGKTTLAYIIGKMVGMEMETYVGGSFTMDNLRDFLIKAGKSQKNMILFIDEVHGLDKSIAEFLLPVLEDFRLPIGNNMKIREFCLIGATTNPEILQKKFAPLIDRCGNIIDLEHYKAIDIKTILAQYNEKTHQISVPNEVYDLISTNTRFNPRTSLSMFDDYVICRDIDRVLKSNQIVKNSLTTKDILILSHLAEIGKPVGLETLAIISQQTKQTYMELQEPFLIQQGYLSRLSKGRVVTEKGKLLLQGLENV